MKIATPLTQFISYPIDTVSPTHYICVTTKTCYTLLAPLLTPITFNNTRLALHLLTIICYTLIAPLLTPITFKNTCLALHLLTIICFTHSLLHCLPL